MGFSEDMRELMDKLLEAELKSIAPEHVPNVLNSNQTQLTHENHPLQNYDFVDSFLNYASFNNSAVHRLLTYSADAKQRVNDYYLELCKKHCGKRKKLSDEQLNKFVKDIEDILIEEFKNIMEREIAEQLKIHICKFL